MNNADPKRFEALRLACASVVTAAAVVALLVGWPYVGLGLTFVGAPMLIDELIVRAMNRR